MSKIIITGCAGFIGCHIAKYFLEKGFTVIGIDDLSRVGSEENLSYLDSLNYSDFIFFKTDIRDYTKIKDIFIQHNKEIDLIIHLAGQVAVTTSVLNPRSDFEINALGTLNLLEATRHYSPNALFEFASTNKVYGKMQDLHIIERNGRYEYETLLKGVDEEYGLDFHSPYGCSKGAADQYVRDYSRIYGIKTVVFRQSCIYGTHQFGVEDQGWVAWFVIASLLGKNITIYGDGKQGRDILWIDDLVQVYYKAYENSSEVNGEIFNIGGGPQNILSLLELVGILKAENVLKSEPNFSDWRPGDQKIFVADISKIKGKIDWCPKTDPLTGIRKLISWAKENEALLRKIVN